MCGGREGLGGRKVPGLKMLYFFSENTVFTPLKTLLNNLKLNYTVKLSFISKIKTYLNFILNPKKGGVQSDTD